MIKSRETLASGDPSPNAASRMVWTTWAIGLVAAVSFVLFAIVFLKIYEHDDQLRKREAEIRGREILAEQLAREAEESTKSIGQLRTRRDSLGIEVAALEEETARLEEKERDANGRLKRLEEREMSLRSELDEVQGRRDEFADVVRQLQAERERFNRERGNLETEIAKFEETRDELQKTLAELNSQVDAFKSEAARQEEQEREEAARREKKERNAEGRLKILEDRERRLVADVGERQKKRDQLAESTNRLEAASERFEKERADLQVAIATLEEKKREAERAHDAAREQLHVIAANVETERTATKEVEEDLNRLRREKQEREAKLAAVATEIEVLRVEERRLRALRAESEGAVRRHEEAQADLAKAVAALATARSDRERLGAEIAAGRVRAEELQTTIAGLGEARREAEGDLAELKQDVERTRKTLNKLESRRKDLESRRQDTESEIAALTRTHQEVSQANERAREQAAALRERQALLSARHRMLEDDVRETSERLRELRAEVGAEEQRRVELGRTIAELAEKTARLQQVAEKARREGEKAREEADRASEEATAAREARKQAEQARARATEEHLGLTEKIRRLSEERSDLEAVITALRVDVRLQEERMNVLRGRESDLTVSIAEKKAQIRRLKAEAEEAEQARQLPGEDMTMPNDRPGSLDVTNVRHPTDGDGQGRPVAPASQSTSPLPMRTREESSTNAAPLGVHDANSTQPADGEPMRKDRSENKQ